MITLLIYLLVLVIVVAVAFWLIGQMGLSPKATQLARIIVGAIALIALLYLLLGSRLVVH